VKRAAAAAVLLLGALRAGAAERILDFDSEIVVNADASLDVTEMLRVRAEGAAIKRGIYRDFPVRYTLPSGLRRTVGFEVVSVERDGHPEPYRTQSSGDYVRVLIGDPDRFVPSGEHSYRLRYRTDRQLGFFPDHTELYWNVTGNDWAFPIDRVEARIHLPPQAGVFTALDAFIGKRGETGKAFTATTDLEGAAVFRATRRLDPGEGLTVAAAWPAGVPAAPPERPGRVILDNPFLSLGGLLAAALLLYYIVVWAAVGRDPSRGTVIPLFEPPDGISAAACRYLLKMGYDHKVFGAAVLGCAAKGHCSITEAKGVFTLEKSPAERPKTRLDGGERAVFSALLGARESIKLETDNHAAVARARKKLKEVLRHSYGKYFRTNSLYFYGGVLVSVLALCCFILSSPQILVGIVPMGLGGIFAAVFGGMLRAEWRKKRAGGKGSGFGIALGVVFFLFAMIFVVFGTAVMARSLNYPVLGAVSLLVILNAVFNFLLKQPSPAGRALMDRIEGFKLFLGVAEKDRLRFVSPPPMTSELFECYLPYAVALGVEQPWSERFSALLERSGQAPSSRTVSWYSGSTGSWLSLNGIGAAATAAASAPSSTSGFSSPGSSSGFGGGGFSGGGGGGGGGGGW